jgi:transcriptional regulator with XRE-family HTH domain
MVMSKDNIEQQYLKRFGGRIRELRLQESISQEELAERAGVHRTYVGMIERGEKNITLLSLLKISSALNRKLAELFEDFQDGQ